MVDKASYLKSNKNNFISNTLKVRQIFFPDYNCKITDITIFHDYMVCTQEGINFYYAISNSIKRLIYKKPKGLQYKSKSNHVDININVESWVKSSFGSNTTKTQSTQSEHSKLVNSIIHKFICIDSKSTIIYGTYAYHLENNAIPFGDIDISTINDFDLIMIIVYGFHIFVKTEVEMLAIPYILNHRSIKTIGAQDDNLADIHHIDKDVMNIIQYKKIDNFYVLGDMWSFFNTFRMLSVDARRESITNDNPKFVKIVSLLMQKCNNYYKPNQPRANIIIVNANTIKLTCKSNSTFYFVNGILDKDYIDFVKLSASTYYPPNIKMTCFKRISNLFGERIIEIEYSSKLDNGSTLIRFDYWINASRNNIFMNTPSTEKQYYTPEISDITKLYFYGTIGILGITINDNNLLSLMYSLIVDSFKNKLEINNIKLYSERVKNNYHHTHISIKPLRFSSLFPEDISESTKWNIH